MVTGCNEEEASQPFRRVPSRGFRVQREPKADASVKNLSTMNGDNRSSQSLLSLINGSCRLGPRYGAQLAHERLR